MHYEGRIDSRDNQKRDMLLLAQRNLLLRIKNPQRGYGEDKGLLVQLQDIRSKLNCVEDFGCQETPSEVSRQDEITDEDLRDMFTVLKKQKEGLDILT